MEFPKNIDSVLKTDEEGFLVCNGKNYTSLLKANNQS